MTGENEHSTPPVAGESPVPSGCPFMAPAIMDEQQAIAYLRIEGVANPSATIKRYRDLGLLRAVRISRHVRYPRVELDAFVQRLLERQGGRAA